MTRCAAALILAAFAAPALAGDGESEHARVEILPGWRAADGSHVAALRIALDDGWKTYWRAPGEAGSPPSFDGSGSQNLARVEVHWPVPEVVSSNGMTTLGYHGELVLPFAAVPVDPDADIVLAGDLALGICHDVCMPMQAEVDAVLPLGVTAEDHRIAGALLARPWSRPAARLRRSPTGSG